MEHHLEPGTDSNRHHQILIVGGGTAGITVAARLLRASNDLDVAVIEPSDAHYYQPLFTFVGGGVFPKERSRRREQDVMPRNANWIRDRVASFQPETNEVITELGTRIGYDYLVVCPGIQLDWHKIEGLQETLGKNGVCSNYAYEQADYTWNCISELREGKALFTTPATPVKCGGAPQKIMYLTADHLRRKGLLSGSEVHFLTPGRVIFGVDGFRETLERVIQRYGIKVHFGHELVAVRGEAKQAVFRVTEEDGTVVQEVESFDMIHVTPPQSAPDCIKNGPLANDAGWLDLDPDTLQHVRYPNIFGLGDASGTPNAKTGAAVRKQAPVVAENLMALIKTGEVAEPRRYDGYSSCPLITGYGKLVLAEFKYGNEPAPSFPFDTAKERFSMYLLKKYGLPWMYWNLMLRGRA